MAIITTADFIGEIAVSLNEINSANFQIYIDRVMPEVLKNLMGDKLYNLYLADLDASGEPQTQIYINLIDGVTYEDNAGYDVIYEGMKRSLRYFIFADYKINMYKNTESGQVRMTSSNSVNSSWFNVFNEANRFNDKGVILFNQAIKYIWTNYEDYFEDLADWTYEKMEMKSGLKTKTLH